MFFPELEKKLQKCRSALDAATAENIIERCKQYLALLEDFVRELHKLPRTLELDSRISFSAVTEAVVGNRKAVRAALEHTIRERNRVGALIRSFTAVSGYEATATLNKLGYEGHNSWELRAGGVRCGPNAEKRMAVQEAVELASLLRRKEFIATQEAINGPNSLSLEQRTRRSH